MSIICRIFGHQPPVYAKKGWYSPGEEYADEVSCPCPDGIGRLHCSVYSICPRCKQRFRLCRIHPPLSFKEDNHVFQPPRSYPRPDQEVTHMTTVKQAMSSAESTVDEMSKEALRDIVQVLAAEVRRLEKTIEDARERNPAVAMVDASDEGDGIRYYAEILPDRTIHVGGMLYAFPPMSVDPKYWKPSCYQWWEAHGQYLRAGGGQYEKTFAGTAHHGHLATWPKWMRDLRLTKFRRRHRDD